MAEPKILCIGCGSDGPLRHIPLPMCAKCEAAWDEIGSRPPTPEERKLFDGYVSPVTP